MKHHHSSQNHPPTEAAASRPNPAAPLIENAGAFTPSADEVARRAYFAYLNEGSRPGRDVQHWLDAEAQLCKERNLTRTHAFHNRT
jgi:hypothetical protein